MFDDDQYYDYDAVENFLKQSIRYNVDDDEKFERYC